MYGREASAVVPPSAGEYASVALIATRRLMVFAQLTISPFELSRWRGGRYRMVGPSIVAGVRFGSQGGYCDPSQEADAG
jgi:hypothetical protein